MESTSPTPTALSPRDRYAQYIIKTHQAKLKKHGPYSAGLPRIAKPAYRAPGSSAPLNIGILGAGAAGLYTALILDSLGDSDITYTILEANPMKDRQGGGRLYTYWFEGGGDNDYYDVGAMRFPDIPFMKPVFDLMRDNPNSPISGKLTPLLDYVMDSDTNLNLFNGKILADAEVAAANKAGNFDPFGTGVSGLTGPVGGLVSAAIGDFKKGLIDDWETGWNTLMEKDEYSTRDWMKFGKPGAPFADDTINYLETFDSATNLYDCALSESVMDSLDFDYGPDVKWYCIQGGAGRIADEIKTVIKIQPQYGKVVTSIAPNNTTGIGGIDITTSDSPNPQNFDHVISTLPFGSLRMVDTTKCGFDWDTQTAIRSLHYDCSVKVAIQFSSRWWESPNLAKGAHKGGVSSTDRPTRVVVYPSYGMKPGDQGASIIVSYTWAQDAMRFGTFVGKPETEDVLLRLIFKDLADMHGMDFDDLWNLKKNYAAYNWYTDEYTAGAFALFGPGQFSNLYTKVITPVGGIFHFAGEATSAHHAWVVGAFNSAWRAVYQLLHAEHRDDLITKMKGIWPEPSEWIGVLPELQTQAAIGQMGAYKGWGRPSKE